MQSAAPRPLSERTGVLDAFIALLVRALDLDRVLFLIDDGTGEHQHHEPRPYRRALQTQASRERVDIERSGGERVEQRIDR